MHSKKICIIVPAFNEERSIYQVVSSIKKLKKKYSIVVVNDASTDTTQKVSLSLNVDIIDLPFNLGVGEAVKTGLVYARENNFEIAVQIDADGQHDARDIPKLVTSLKSADMVIGSRYIKKTKYITPFVRLVGIKIFSDLIYLTCNQRIYDSTSGFKALNRKAINFFSNYDPQEFPDPALRVSFLKNGYKIKEVPVEMKERLTGKSSFGWLYSIYLLFSVSISILLESVKVYKLKNE